MIQNITFNEIEFYWKTYLWSKYTDKGYKINKINLTTQDNYIYGFLKYLKQEEIEKVILATYIAYYKDSEIIGVYSGYKTNIDYYRLRGLWVDENYRHLGIAKKMMNYLVEYNRSDNKYFWTIPRESALGFYQKQGFKITGLFEKTIYGQNYFAIKEII